MISNLTIDVPEATVAYDVHGPLPPEGGRSPLMMIGQPMDASGFATLASHFVMTSWQGEFTDEYAAQPAPDPAQFGMPADDDGSREDPLLSGVSDPITNYRPDVDAVHAAPTRVVIGVGIESQGTFTGPTAVAVAQALGQEPIVFPNRGGFLGGEFGYAGEPEAFAATLHQVLAPGPDQP